MSCLLLLFLTHTYNQSGRIFSLKPHIAGPLHAIRLFQRYQWEGGTFPYSKTFKFKHSKQSLFLIHFFVVDLSTREGQ